jgi:hypothetical protein
MDIGYDIIDVNKLAGAILACSDQAPFGLARPRRATGPGVSPAWTLRAAEAPGRGAEGEASPIQAPPGHGPRRNVPQHPMRAAGSVPHHVQAAVTVEVTAHGVKRSRPPGKGPARGVGEAASGRGPTRRGAGPPGRPENAKHVLNSFG